MKQKQNFTIVSAIFTILLNVSVIISQLYVLFGFKNSGVAIMLILFAVVASVAGCVLSAMMSKKKFMQNKLIIFSNLGIVMFLFLMFAVALLIGFKVYGFYFTVPLAILALTFNIISISVSASNNDLVVSKEQKISLLKKLKDSGEISEAEYKTLLIKELEK